MPKAATNEIEDDPRFFSLPPEKVGESRDEQEDKIKVVDLEKVDFGKVDSKEQFDQEKEDGEDGKDCFEGSQVSESSESLSQVRIMMWQSCEILLRVKDFTFHNSVIWMMMMITTIVMMMMTKCWCCISASCTNTAFMVVNRLLLTSTFALSSYFS